MALVDDPKAFILRMFDMESREGRGDYCRVFENGFRPDELPLDKDELVYGIYKDKYHFSPQSLCIKEVNSVRRIVWQEISSCSTRHGDGNKNSVLTLVDGRTIDVRVGELAIGWAGRTSQLFHKMIERWGSRPFAGLPLLSISDYFGKATDTYSFAPNLEPHPSLGEIKMTLAALSERADVEQVMISVVEYEREEPIATGVVIVSNAPATEFSLVRDALSASEIFLASENTRRKLNVGSDAQVWEMVWT